MSISFPPSSPPFLPPPPSLPSPSLPPPLPPSPLPPSLSSPPPFLPLLPSLPPYPLPLLQRAAQSLRELTDEFSEESNPMVSVGKKMSEQMTQMAEFARGKGDLKDKTDMILTAKAVEANGQTIHRIASAISKQCEDMRSRNNLLCCAEMILTLSTQLTILASVKTATPDDSSVSDVRACDSCSDCKGFVFFPRVICPVYTGVLIRIHSAFTWIHLDCEQRPPVWMQSGLTQSTSIG